MKEKGKSTSPKKKPVLKKKMSKKESKLLHIRLSKWMKMLEDYPEKVHMKLK